VSLEHICPQLGYGTATPGLRLLMLFGGNDLVILLTTYNFVKFSHLPANLLISSLG
jgi:hypothetical protein